ncbi:hypothetical protein N1031_07310 [Herbiconiux moechotypicola]|uniref:Uncharacterized protein n=1 Tax=Herbiconiux moechotypicola TaxID=637393 RepID=A0ABN3DGS4_9MICO|nr:hypothetical protein [Herbiconiux moechotypicola]MCS5729565.1 hypothetical protein [Herbiconiux moechotypicola]
MEVPKRTRPNWIAVMLSSRRWLVACAISVSLFIASLATSAGWLTWIAVVGGVLSVTGMLNWWSAGFRPTGVRMLITRLTVIGHDDAVPLRCSIEFLEAMAAMRLDAEDLTPLDYLAYTDDETAFAVWQLRRGEADALFRCEWAAVARAEFGEAHSGTAIERAIVLVLAPEAAGVRIPLAFQELAGRRLRPVDDEALHARAEWLERRVAAQSA